METNLHRDLLAEIEKLSSDQKEQLGNKAMSLIGDYPLYASCSGITYEEAIAIALVLGFEEDLAAEEE